MRTKLFLISAFCFLLSASSYAQTITTAGVAWNGTNGGPIMALDQSGVNVGTNRTANAGSSINGIAFTNNNLTVPGNLDVAGTTGFGTVYATQLVSTVTGNTNRVTIWGPNGNATNVSLVNLTLDTGVFPATLTASTGSGSTGSNIVDNGYAAEARNINISTNLTVTSTNLGTTITLRSISTNASIAAVGAQQVSPATMWFGNGWMTTPSASTNVGMGLYTLPVQGSTIPTAQLHFVKKIGGAAAATVGNIDDAGTLTIGSMVASGFVRASSSSGFNLGSGFPTIYASSADEANVKRNSTAGNYANLTVSNIVSSGFSRATNGYWMPSNSLAIWPAAPLNPGDAYCGNSNGTIYLLQSGMGATWTSTNKIGQ